MRRILNLKEAMSDVPHILKGWTGRAYLFFVDLKLIRRA